MVKHGVNGITCYLLDGWVKHGKIFHAMLKHQYLASRVKHVKEIFRHSQVSVGTQGLLSIPHFVKSPSHL